MAGPSLNMVQIIGRVGRDPEMRYTQTGMAKVEFSVAVDNYAKAGQDATTEWFNVVAWDKLAETCNQLVVKGRVVYMQGRLQTRSWEGPDGQKKYRTELVADRMQLLDKPPQGRESGGYQAPADEPDDIPF